MTQDPNKKTLRSFQCRDYLWEIFDQMSQELECSVDYLVNEAMRQYARSRNYGTRPSVSPPRPSNAPQGGGGIPPMGAPKAPAGDAASIPSAPPPPPPRPSGGYSQPGHYPPASGGSASSYPPGVTQRPAGYPPPPPAGGNAAPPPLPHSQRPPAPEAGASPPSLYVIFNGQKIPITKNEFVIGRGSKTADLPIKDGNISRRHAAVVYQDGTYYMKDLGSTNGIEFGGRRVDSKRVEEGDVFQICDYELRFTYR
jgi:hypothetical protein